MTLVLTSCVNKIKSILVNDVTDAIVSVPTVNNVTVGVQTQCVQARPAAPGPQLTHEACILTQNKNKSYGVTHEIKILGSPMAQ